MNEAITAKEYLAGLESVYLFNNREVAHIGLVLTAEEQQAISEHEWHERKLQIINKLKPLLLCHIIGDYARFDYVTVFQNHAYGCQIGIGDIDDLELEAISGIKPITLHKPQDVPIRGNYL